MKIMIVGGGKVGSHLASMLLSENHQVKVIENRPAEIDRLCEELGQDVVVCGSGSDPEVLEAAGIRTVDVVATVTGSDETNLVVSSLAHFEFHVPRVIARVNNSKNAWLYTRDMGVDVAIDQSDLMGRLIAEDMSLGAMNMLLKLRRGEYSLIEEKVLPGASAAEKSLREMGLPEHCVVASIFRQDELIFPRGDTVLQVADDVLAVVHSSEVQKLAEILGSYL